MLRRLVDQVYAPMLARNSTPACPQVSTGERAQARWLPWIALAQVERPTQFLSRNTRDLGQWFPELMRAARTLPPGTVVDGEIVICDDSGWLDFGAFQARLGKARNTVSTVARERPAIPDGLRRARLTSVPLVGSRWQSVEASSRACSSVGMSKRKHNLILRRLLRSLPAKSP
jgi:hypothetical protein